ncbi:MAG: tRNA (adenosine(37)-N6)-dimethylallyltransferase MiaA [Burkholderiales bacterium]|nr:tRNA (adenosine(37)-N6)-dimethylallyltransferase MiaA [Burkholderiales bacterium]
MSRSDPAARGDRSADADTDTDTPLLGLCLAGPTGAGKTAVALAFARALAEERGQGREGLQHGRAGTAVEIISVDSAAVYRGMDVGTAKPSAAERAEVPHHLIDILDPREAYSAAAFAQDARRIAGEIRARGRLPLLVGGTMLYFKALREGLDAMPAADPALRAALDAEAAARGWPALHAELARVDPVTAARLAPHDSQRIQRALEVWRTSGRTLSDWQARGHRHGQPASDPARPDSTSADPTSADPTAADPTAADTALPGTTSPNTRADDRRRWPLVSLEPASRAWLHERIARRFAAMLEQGLLDEVRALRARGDLHAGLPSMRCVGYRQAWAALDSGRLTDLASTGAAATRQLAKRQLTWLRSMPDRHVVPCDACAGPHAADALAQGVAALRRAAQAGGGAARAP